ncbi:MAG: ECF transporter S component [Clostridia bacterium]
MRNINKSKKIALLSLLFALIIVLQLLAELLRILGMPMSFALGLIPVLVVAQTHGYKYGLVAGLMFGIVSMLIALIGASANPMFMIVVNPLISVFPRIMVGLVCGFVFYLTNKNNTSKKKRYLYSSIATICGVLTNTILFLGMFFVFARGRTFDTLTINFKWIMTTVVALNTIVELVVFTIVVPVIVNALFSSEKLNLTNPNKD